RAGCACFPLRPLRARFPLRPLRTLRAGVALVAFGTGRTLDTLAFLLLKHDVTNDRADVLHVSYHARGFIPGPPARQLIKLTTNYRAPVRTIRDHDTNVPPGFPVPIVGYGQLGFVGHGVIPPG